MSRCGSSTSRLPPTKPSPTANNWRKPPPPRKPPSRRPNPNWPKSGCAKPRPSSARAATVGRVIPRLELTNGKVLLDAKLQKFSPTTLKFNHSGGTTQVQWAQLPKDLSDQLGAGLVPRDASDALEDTQVEIVDSNDGSDADAKTEPATKKEAGHKEADEKEKLMETLANLRGQLNSAQLTLQKVMAELGAAKSKAAKNPNQIATLQKKAAAIQKNINLLQQKINRIVASN